MATKAQETFLAGVAVLKPLLVSNGFSFKLINSERSSGGDFAFGEFGKNGRRLELHFRHSLGMVSYHLAAGSMSHRDYMRSMLGKANSSHYPGFSDDPLDAFRDLRTDLEEYGADFLLGSDACLLDRINRAKTLPRERVGLPK